MTKKQIRKYFSILSMKEIPWQFRISFLPGKARVLFLAALSIRDRRDFLANIDRGNFSERWFLRHFPLHWWLARLLRQKSRGAAMLEIGSWEGLSAYFHLWANPDLRIVCVDTFEGSEENASVPAGMRALLEGNLDRFKGRFAVFEGSSEEYFESQPQAELFDLIYIDGSHLAEDILNDARNSLNRLKPGGFLVFDDFFWNYYPDPAQNPAAAISKFFSQEQTKLRHFGYQVVLQKPFNLR